MKFSIVATAVAALGLASNSKNVNVAAVCFDIDFNTNRKGEAIKASCHYLQFQNECTNTASCKVKYGDHANDCVRFTGNLGDAKGNVCACGDSPVLCGCEDFVPPGLASKIEFPAGMTVTAQRKGKSEQAALLFNSATGQSTGEDNDLEVDSGNILIISEDGDINDPDDAFGGGKITFNFANPVNVKRVIYADTEATEGADISAFDSDVDYPIASQDLPALSDRELRSQDFEVYGVDRLEVTLGGSGAVAELRVCTADPGSFGDPHFVTWGGDYYDYHGICDLLFLDSPANNLMVQLRTEKKFHYSYIASAAVQINDEVFEFGSWGQVIVNGVYMSDDMELPTTFGGHPMTLTKANKKEHVYTVDFGDNTGLEVKTYKDMVAVRVIGSHSNKFNDARGLMGAPISGEKLGRDGAVWNLDLNAFGQEWQVLGEEPTLFSAVREPQAPHQRCMAPSEMDDRGPELKTRRLGESMARSEAEAACANWKMNKEACIADVMTTGDKDVANAFAN